MSGIRDLYDEYGVADYYRLHGNEYRNPHEPIIEKCIDQAYSRWPLKLIDVLDLACGSGEVTKALQRWPNVSIKGMDPYTYAAYERRTGRPCHRMSFEDVANGQLPARYTEIFCSYALHLVDQSRLPLLCWRLALDSQTLIVITPHKRPKIDISWGFKLTDEFKIDGTRTRYYVRRAAFLPHLHWDPMRLEVGKRLPRKSE